ncbi:Hypothetical predicted protein, partial [Paramuricea clavata]
MDRGLFNIAVFLDLQKAFDTINHDILLTKLDLYGLQKPSLNLLGSYLANRTQMCSVNGALSGTKLVTCGIPQGSILGPLLFLIYINDLPNSLEYSSTRMFADDTTLTVSGKSIQDVEVAINHDLTNVKQWLSANRLSLNLVKTEYLLIGSRYNKNNLLAAPNVFVGDTPIKKVKETKALGVHIDEFLLNVANTALRSAKRDYYANKFTTNKQNPKYAWRTINDILGRNRKQTTINEIKLPGKTVTSTDELVDIFNDHFSNIGPKLAESIPNDNDVSFRDFITQQKSKTKNSFSFRPVSVTLVYTLLVNLSTTKATGMDKISAKILQVAAPVIAPSLTEIFNMSIDSDQFPSDWKAACK